ncbi:MAG: biotin/lipoyl-binding protein [Selenomonadaceae bacterium]|nr:biotin/lipoyl-binding protein [Selenomonadaceae bacterium]
MARQYRKYRNALKILTLVLIISVGFGIFYWRVTAAKAEVVENWGKADAKEININSKVAGRVVKLFVEEGARVEQGQLIAKIDSDTQEPQQRSAQANLAAKDEARYRELLEAEAIPAQTYDAYRSKLKDAQAVLTAAQAEVTAAQENLLKNDENKVLELAAREQAAALQGNSTQSTSC